VKPLREQSARAARQIAEANAAFAPTPGEQAASWARLQRSWDGEPDETGGHRRARRRAGWRLLLGAGALAALGALLWMVLPPRTAQRMAERAAAWVAPGASHPVPTPAAPAWSPPAAGTAAQAPLVEAPTPAPAPVAPESPPAPSAPIALRPGRSVLGSGVRARLAPRGAATIRAGAGRAAGVLALQRGVVDVDIDAARTALDDAGQAGASSRLEIQVAAFRLEAQPGRFRVSARGGRVDVAVKSGKLAVWSSRRLLATVVAGERWTNLAPDGRDRSLADGDAAGGPGKAAAELRPPEDDAAAAANPASPARAAAADADCGRLTRQGAIDPALACFAHEAAQPGLVGELALIELARIRRDVKGDLAGAEQALAEHRRRFPHGALADEAAGSRVELLLRLGRAAEALAEAEHLTGGDAIFWRAVCLSKLGRREEAVQAFDDYLARPGGKRRAEAARMRAELQR